MRSRAAGTSGTGRNSPLKPNRPWGNLPARTLSLSSQMGRGIRTLREQGILCPGRRSFLRRSICRHQLQPGTDARAWLVTILLNTARDWARKTLRQPETLGLDDLTALYQQATTEPTRAA